MSSSPFIVSTHRPPSFNPVKIGSRAAGIADNRPSKSAKPTHDPKAMGQYARCSRKSFQPPQIDGKVSLQAIEEETDDEFSIKHAAAARFARNQRLINEIFSDIVVPDVRSVVTTPRLKVLKNQVHSLQTHQKKLETELQQIEEKFEAKKRKFLEASEAFQLEMKKRCSVKPVDQASFQKMVEKALEQTRREQASKEEQMKRKAEEQHLQYQQQGEENFFIINL